MTTYFTTNTYNSSTTTTTGALIPTNSTGNFFTNAGNLIVSSPSSLLSVASSVINRFNRIKVQDNYECEIELPDGTIIKVDDTGNFVINDANSKVVYRGNNIREFNRFLNASDLLEQFIKDMGLVGVKQDEILNVSIGLFINWLIVRSAEQDGEEVPPDIKKVEYKKDKPRCKCCGRFLSNNRFKAGLLFCNSDHFEKYEHKLMESCHSEK